MKINKNGEVLIITKSGQDTNGQVTEFEGMDEPGIGPPMHVHFLQEEKVKLLKGEMRVRTSDSEFEVKVGEEYTFAAGIPHQFWNSGKETNHYSGSLIPSCNWEYIIEKVYESANAAGSARPSPFDAAYLMTKYKKEIDLLVIPRPVKHIVFPILYVVGHILGKYKKYKNAPRSITRK